MEFETLIESTTRENARIALRRNVSETLMPYVVHFHNLKTDGYFWGDYFCILEDAQQDYVIRCKREGVHLSLHCEKCFESLGGELNLIRIEFEDKLKRIQEKTRNLEEVD